MSRTRRIESLRRLVEHPGTPAHERAAALAMLQRLGAGGPETWRQTPPSDPSSRGSARVRDESAFSEKWERFGARYDPRRSVHDVAVLVRKELDARRAKGKAAADHDLIAALPPWCEIAINAYSDTLQLYVFGVPLDWISCPRRQQRLPPGAEGYSDRAWALRAELEEYLESFAARGLDGDDRYASLNCTVSVRVRERSEFDLEFETEY